MVERFTEAKLDEIKAAVSISTVVGEHVTWDKGKSTKDDKWACCPFHGENSPSFHADDRRGKYHCFGCGADGDHFQFLTEHTGMDFVDAVKTVAGMGGVHVEGAPAPARHKREAEPPPRDEPPDDAYEEAATAAPSSRRVDVETYDYVNRDGETIYQVVRQQWQIPDGTWELGKSGTPKKTFLQRRKDASGKIIYNLDGIGHTIYRHNIIEAAIADGKTIYMPEGEKDVHTLEAWGLVATTNSGGAKNWQPHLAELFRGADVVILGDDDEPGRKRCTDVAMSLRGIAARIRVHFAWGGPKDVTDWAIATEDNAARLAVIVDALPDWRPPPPQSQFGALTLDAPLAEPRRGHREWLVQDLIELGGTCSFAGFTQSGKSFIVLDLSMSVARGIPFWGREVEQGLVVYQVGEGASGFRKRVEGYLQDRGVEDRAVVPLVILPRRINLFVDDKDTEALIAECRQWEAYRDQKLRLIVIDTFNKATRGSNEISGQDNGKIIDRVERIARECDCTVIVVDHLSAQGRVRGHTSKSDDMTTVIKVSADQAKRDRNGRAMRKLFLEKNKDGENGVSIPFVLRAVSIGADDRGKEVTTCVVDAPDGDEHTQEQQGRLSLNQATILRSIRDTSDIEGAKAPPELVHVPPGRNVSTFEQVKARLQKTWGYKETEPAKKEAELRRAFIDAIKRLRLAGFLDWDNERGLIWWTGKEDRARPAPKPEPKAAPPMSARADTEVPF